MLTAIRTNQQCVCSNSLPLLSARAPDSACNSRADPKLIAIFYNSKSAGFVVREACVTQRQASGCVRPVPLVKR